MADKIYVPNCTAKEVTARFGPILKLSFKSAAFREFLNEHTNDKGYINLEIQRRKETGKYGETHSVTLDTWKPTPQGGDQPQRRQEPKPNAGYSTNGTMAADDLKF